MEWTGYVENNESLSKKRSDIDNHPDDDTDEEAIEHEMTDLHQKMKYPGCNSQYYDPINILSVSTKFSRQSDELPEEFTNKQKWSIT